MVTAAVGKTDVRWVIRPSTELPWTDAPAYFKLTAWSVAWAVVVVAEKLSEKFQWRISQGIGKMVDFMSLEIFYDLRYTY